MIVFWVTISLYAQNDLCENAIAIIPNSSCIPTQGTFSGSTISTPLPNCANNASQDVWYSFVATEKMMGITLFGTAGISNGFQVYESSCSGTSVICSNTNNASGSSESILYNNFTVGTTYLIRIFNAFSAPTTNSFSICLVSYPAPNNDNCANAIPLTPSTSCVPTTVDLSGATLDGSSVTSCSPNPSQDVWFSFVATDEVMSIALSTNSTISNGFEVYQNSCNGNLVVCRNVNGNGSGEFLSWSNLIIGETYYIRVLNEFITPSTVSFTICLRNYPPPVNDECANASSLPVNSTCSTNTVAMSGATLDGPTSASCSPNPSQDVWYKFIATNTSLTVTISLISDISNGFQVYQNGCNGTMLVCRNNNGNGQGETFTFNGYVVGQEYYIRVLNEYSTPLTTASFNVCVIDPTLGNPEFDDSAVIVTPNPFQNEIVIQSDVEIYRLELFDLFGKKVIDQVKEISVVKTDQLEKGMYLLKIYSASGKISVKKIIKN